MGLTLEGAVARSNHLADTANANIKDGKVVLKTNMEDEVSNYLRYRQAFMNSAETALNEATQTFVDTNAPMDEFEIVDNEEEMGKTMFGMTMIGRADDIFTPEPTQKVEEVEAPVDNVSDNSFIISRDELSTLNQKVRPEDNFASAITPIEEPETEEYEGEVVSFEEEQTKSKVKTLGKRAAYVDTVILCLIAQLSIFGLLIIVLLIIK